MQSVTFFRAIIGFLYSRIGIGVVQPYIRKLSLNFPVERKIFFRILTILYNWWPRDQDHMVVGPSSTAR